MAWSFLILGAVFGVGKGYFGKRASISLSNFSHSITINTLRMPFSVVIGGVFALVVSGSSAFAIQKEQALVCLFSGISLSAFTVCWMMLVREHAYLLVDVFLTCGSVVPIVLSSLAFGEQPLALQFVGVGVLVLSALCMCRYNRSIKSNVSLKTICLLSLVGVLYGLYAFFQKWYANFSSPVSVYNFYTYLIGALALSLCSLLVKSEGSCRLKIGKHDILNVIYIALCMFFNSLFLTLSAKTLPAYTVFPIKQGISLVLSLAMSILLFKERLKPIAVLGVVLSFFAMLLINC